MLEVTEVNRWKTHSSAVHVEKWSLQFVKNTACIAMYFRDTIFRRAMQAFKCHSKDFIKRFVFHIPDFAMW